MRDTRVLRTTLRAVIYVRVSQDRKGQGKSVSEQETESRQTAHEEGFLVVEMFKDNDKSASRHAKKSRPGYLEMRDYLKTGNVDVLILWESSRGSRELEDWAGLLNLCRRMKILIHVISHGRTYDMENPRDWRTLAEDGIDSQYESEKTRERILRSVRSNQASGKPHGKLLYGYSREFDQRGNAHWVINEAQAVIVREAAERTAQGEALYAIAADFNARGIPTPRTDALPRLIEAEKDFEKRDKLTDELETAKYQWDPQQIKRLCNNPAYIGMRAVGGQAKRWQIVGKAVWDPIIDDQTFQACADIFNTPGRDPRRNADNTIKHLLSGIARTPCGGRVRLAKNRTHFAYICEVDFCVSMEQERLESYVIAQTKERLITLSVAETAESAAHGDAERSKARKEAEDLRRYLEDFTKEAAAERLSATRIAAVEREIMPRIEALEARSRAARIPRVIWRLVHEPKKLDTMTMPEKRQLLRSMVTITLLKIGRGKRSYEISDRVDLDWHEDQMMRQTINGS